jgi:peroxiredoxin
MKQRWKVYALIVSVSLAGGVFGACSAKQSKNNVGSEPTAESTAPSSKTGTSVGDLAPDFQLARLDGAQLKLTDLRGEPAVLIFWTAWCPVCKEEAPNFNQLATTYEPRGVRVVGINIQDSLARTEGGVRDFGIKYPVVRDADADIARLYKVIGTPTIIFLDRNGAVRYFGNELPVDYPSRLEELIGQKS